MQPGKWRRAAELTIGLVFVVWLLVSSNSSLRPLHNDDQNNAATQAGAHDDDRSRHHDAVIQSQAPVTTDATTRNSIHEAPAAVQCTPRDLVVSVGGVGTTHTIKLIGRDLNAFNDADGLKHRPFDLELVELARKCATLQGKSKGAQVTVSGPSLIRRVLYVYGDPVHSVLSLAIRNYLKPQCKKLLTYAMQKPKHPELGCNNASAYADARVDLLMFESHFDSWFLGAQDARAIVGEQVDITRRGAEVVFVYGPLLRDSKVAQELLESEDPQEVCQRVVRAAQLPFDALEQGWWMEKYTPYLEDTVKMAQTYASLRDKLNRVDFCKAVLVPVPTTLTTVVDGPASFAGRPLHPYGES